MAVRKESDVLYFLPRQFVPFQYVPLYRVTKAVVSVQSVLFESSSPQSEMLFNKNRREYEVGSEHRFLQ